jgi:hypothetical protein
LPSLANGAGLFLLKEIIEEKWAKLRMSQVKKVYTPTTLFLRDSWVQIPPPALLNWFVKMA